MTIHSQKARKSRSCPFYRTFSVCWVDLFYLLCFSVFHRKKSRFRYFFGCFGSSTFFTLTANIIWSWRWNNFSESEAHENSERRRTDNAREEISPDIIKANKGYCVDYSPDMFAESCIRLKSNRIVGHRFITKHVYVLVYYDNKTLFNFILKLKFAKHF